MICYTHHVGSEFRISSAEIECVSPTFIPGAVAVEASNDGQIYSASGLTFTYVNMELISPWTSMSLRLLSSTEAR